MEYQFEGHRPHRRLGRVGQQPRASGSLSAALCWAVPLLALSALAGLARADEVRSLEAQLGVRSASESGALEEFLGHGRAPSFGWSLPRRPEFVGSELARDWFALASKLTQRTAGFSPPVASRAFAYLSIALYEAIVPGSLRYRTLAGQLTALERDALPDPRLRGKLFSAADAANAALSEVARAMYATETKQAQENLALIEQLAAKHERASRVHPLVRWKSAEFGKALAAAILKWAEADGGHLGHTRNFPESHVPPTGTGMWVPTAPAFSRALQPLWGNNRTFVPASIDVCDPGPPPAFSTAEESPFMAEAMEVYDAVLDATPEQQAIALFWSDDPGTTATPPGHSLSLATIVLETSHSSLSTAAETYVRVALSVADSFVACWRSKFKYNLLRPISYIQEHIDPAWTPLLATPPFPEYPSGHSVQSGAMATALAAQFGQMSFVDSTHAERGLAARHFESFDDAAEEAAISRLYGGIHFRAAIDLGVTQGRCIGERINALKFRRFASWFDLISLLEDDDTDEVRP